MFSQPQQPGTLGFGWKPTHAQQRPGFVNKQQMIDKILEIERNQLAMAAELAALRACLSRDMDTS
jgi:hypothetical protein